MNKDYQNALYNPLGRRNDWLLYDQTSHIFFLNLKEWVYINIFFLFILCRISALNCIIISVFHAFMCILCNKKFFSLCIDLYDEKISENQTHWNTLHFTDFQRWKWKIAFSAENWNFFSHVEEITLSQFSDISINIKRCTKYFFFRIFGYGLHWKTSTFNFHSQFLMLEKMATLISELFLKSASTVL